MRRCYWSSAWAILPDFPTSAIFIFHEFIAPSSTAHELSAREQ
ncbi:hypothetical protein [Entomobacter blattae]|nr:hypothetical protein [Entomobacter blattae]